MSVLLLEKLQKKPVPKDIEKPVAIKLGSEQVDIQITIEDQSGSTNFDVNFFKERIKRRGLAPPKIQEKVGTSWDNVICGNMLIKLFEVHEISETLGVQFLFF